MVFAVRVITLEIFTSKQFLVETIADALGSICGEKISAKCLDQAHPRSFLT